MFKAEASGRDDEHIFVFYSILYLLHKNSGHFANKFEMKVNCETKVLLLLKITD